LRAIIANAPDLILLDLSVPYLDGFEMIKALRNDPATRNIPVIVLTGRGDDETYTRARELGAAQLPDQAGRTRPADQGDRGQLGSRPAASGKKIRERLPFRFLAQGAPQDFSHIRFWQFLLNSMYLGAYSRSGWLRSAFGCRLR